MNASHPSDFLLERYVVSDVSSDMNKQISTHILSCSVCDDKYKALKTFSEQYIKDRPAQMFASQINARQRSVFQSFIIFLRSIRASYAMVLATLCVCGFLVIKSSFDLTEYRLKGSRTHSLQIYLKRQENVNLLRAEQKIRARDALKIKIPTVQKMEVEVYIVESNKNIMPYPQGPFFSLSNTEQVLPHSLEITAPCRDLWILVNLDKKTSSMLPSVTKILEQGGFNDAVFKQLNVDEKIHLRCEENE